MERLPNIYVYLRGSAHRGRGVSELWKGGGGAHGNRSFIYIHKMSKNGTKKKNLAASKVDLLEICGEEENSF